MLPVKMKLSTKVSMLPVTLQLTALATERKWESRSRMNIGLSRTLGKCAHCFIRSGDALPVSTRQDGPAPESASHPMYFKRRVPPESVPNNNWLHGLHYQHGASSIGEMRNGSSDMLSVGTRDPALSQPYGIPRPPIITLRVMSGYPEGLQITF